MTPCGCTRLERAQVTWLRWYSLCTSTRPRWQCSTGSLEDCGCCVRCCCSGLRGYGSAPGGASYTTIPFWRRSGILSAMWRPWLCSASCTRRFSLTHTPLNERTHPARARDGKRLRKGERGKTPDRGTQRERGHDKRGADCSHPACSSDEAERENERCKPEQRERCLHPGRQQRCVNEEGPCGCQSQTLATLHGVADLDSWILQPTRQPKT